MTDFWIYAALLVLAGMLVMLWPVWRARKQHHVDRNALNVALFEERVAELQAQRDAGELSEGQFVATRDEASRLLLEDTEETDQPRLPFRPSRAAGILLLVLAGLLPVAVVTLYNTWGSLPALALYREIQDQPEPQSMQEVAERMQRITSIQPDNGEAWFMLGRALLSTRQPQAAVAAFERSMQVLGEHPEILAQMAQARFFASDNQLDSRAVAALDRALELNPQEPTALGLLGIASFEAGDYPAAIQYWGELLKGMPPGSDGARSIESGIERAQRLLEQGDEPAVDQAELQLRIELSLAEGLADNLDVQQAAVFLFARELEGEGMPLLARRIALNELPAALLLGPEDSMLPGTRLQSGQRLQLIARLSPGGDVMHSSHEGRVAEVLLGDDQVYRLRVEIPLQ